jgi:hypothetical protein
MGFAPLSRSGSSIFAFHFIGQPTKGKVQFFKRMFDIYCGAENIKICFDFGEPRSKLGPQLWSSFMKLYREPARIGGIPRGYSPSGLRMS